jgi:hypothetical protein
MSGHGRRQRLALGGGHRAVQEDQIDAVQQLGLVGARASQAAQAQLGARSSR